MLNVKHGYEKRRFEFNKTTIVSKKRPDQDFWTTKIRTGFNTITVRSDFVCSCDASIVNEKLEHVLGVIWFLSGHGNSDIIDIDGAKEVKSAKLLKSIIMAILNGISIQTVMALY